MATILIVDDLASNRTVLAALLGPHGHRLLEATNGAEALTWAAAEPVDLVITDVLMPVMDGYELVRRLSANPATARVPVVFYTAHYGEYEARELARSMGVADVIVKPIDPRAVIRLVGDILRGAVTSATPEAEPADLDRAHLRLLTDKLSATTEDLLGANAKLRALINIGLELASQKDTSSLLASVCTSARDLFAASYATLGIIDRDTGRLYRVLVSGIEPTPWLLRGDVIPGVLARVMRERRVLRGVNADGDPTALGLPSAHPPVTSYLAAPIASPAHVYGWIFLAGEQGTQFAESDESLALALSGQVGRTYENGYFYAIAQRRATALEREVAEREQAERVATQERNRAQRYLDTAEVMLIALDTRGRVTLANRTASDLLGWSEAELIGRLFETSLPRPLQEEARRRFSRLLEGDTAPVESPIVTRSGEERLIEWRNTLLRDDAGQVIGTLSSGADVTERVRATQALRVAEERMRFALESAGVGIWDMDYATGALTWSGVLEAQHGMAPGTFDGTFDTYVGCMHPDDRDAAVAVIDEAVRRGSDFSLEYRAVQPDGTLRHLRGGGRILLDADGRPTRGVGVSLDVTQGKRLEEQFHQAQKMEAIGRLAGGVAHDFNNLLTAILGYCELLLPDFSPDDPRRADIEEVQKAGVSAAGLTRQLLAFSRKEIIEPTILDLNEVIAPLDAMLKRLIGADVEVKLRLAPTIGCIKADRGQIEQIVMNLAINARDAMPLGGMLTIQTENVELDESYAERHVAARPGRYVGLTVWDTGSGIPPDVKARMFEPFFTTKAPGKGTGLGLATVHGIVTAAGGTVEVYSEMGRGTTFKLYFPRSESAETAAVASERVALPPATGQTILVVEDADGLRLLTCRLLERQGYTVLVAANANDALALFDRHPSIDLLLTDVVMPGPSGADLTKEIAKLRPGMKVIYMSGYTEEAIVHHGVLRPGIAFLHKPFTSDALARKVREVLGG